jgi:hypothetical protein
VPTIAKKALFWAPASVGLGQAKRAILNPFCIGVLPDGVKDNNEVCHD